MLTLICVQFGSIHWYLLKTDCYPYLRVGVEDSSDGKSSQWFLVWVLHQLMWKEKWPNERIDVNTTWTFINDLATVQRTWKEKV
jgi:hypothetical protein